MVKRHNAVARIIYTELSKTAKFSLVHYRDGIPALQENQSWKLYWDVPIETFQKKLEE